MRAQAFHVIATNGPLQWFLLAFFPLTFMVHVVLSVLMIVRFILGVKSLAQVKCFSSVDQL